MIFFKTKKPDTSKDSEVSQDNIDLQIINRMNQEFAISLDLDETLNTALKLIIERLNAQAANIFLINNKTKKFECIASQNQDHLDEYQLDLKDGVMGKAVEQKKCIRVGDVRKDVREIAEFYFDFTLILIIKQILQLFLFYVLHSLQQMIVSELFIV